MIELHKLNALFDRINRVDKDAKIVGDRIDNVSPRTQMTLMMDTPTYISYFMNPCREAMMMAIRHVPTGIDLIYEPSLDTQISAIEFWIQSSNVDTIVKCNNISKDAINECKQQIMVMLLQDLQDGAFDELVEETINQLVKRDINWPELTIISNSFSVDRSNT